MSEKREVAPLSKREKYYDTEFWGASSKDHVQDFFEGESVREEKYHDDGFWRTSQDHVQDFFGRETIVDTYEDSEFWETLPNKNITEFWEELTPSPGFDFWTRSETSTATIDKITQTLITDITSAPSEFASVRVLESITEDTLSIDQKLKASSWLQTYIIPILWTVAVTTVALLAIFFAYSWMVGVAWETLLYLLYYMGLGDLPLTIFGSYLPLITFAASYAATPAKYIGKTISSTGVKLRNDLTIEAALKLAQKNEHVHRALQTRIPTAYVEDILRKLGVEDPKNVTLEQVFSGVFQESLNAGITIASGGIEGYALSQGIKYGIMGATKGYSLLRGESRTRSQRPEKLRSNPEKVASAVAESSGRIKKEIVTQILKPREALEEASPIFSQTFEMVDLEASHFQEKVGVPQEKTRVEKSRKKKRILIEEDTRLLTQEQREKLERGVPLSSQKGVPLKRTSPKGKEPETPKIRRKTPIPTPAEATPLVSPPVALSSKSLPPSVEISSNVREATEVNGLMVATSIASISLVAIALTGTGPKIVEIFSDQISRLSTRAAQVAISLPATGIDYLQESSRARQTIVGMILEQVGVGGVLNTFADRLLDQQKGELKELSDAISREKDSSLRRKFIDRFLGIISGGYLSPSEIANLSLEELTKKYQYLYPYNSSENLSVEELRDAVYREQHRRVERLNGLVSSALRKILKVSTSIAVEQGLSQGWETLSEHLSDLNRESERIQSLLENRSNEAKLNADQFRKDLEQIKLDEEAAEALKKATREAARAAADAGRAAKAAREAAEKIAKDAAHSAALGNLADRVAQRNLELSANLEDLARKMDVVIVRPDGISHPLPPEDVLLPEALRKVLGFEFTPLAQYLTKQGVAYSSSWIPGVGWIQHYSQLFNLGMNAAETTKDFARVMEVLTRLQTGDLKEGAAAKILSSETLGEALKFRLPSLTDAVDKVVASNKLKAEDVLVRALRDKVLEGWDNQRLAWELGKQVLFGSWADISSDVQTQIGQAYYNAVTSSDFSGVAQLDWKSVFPDGVPKL